LLLLEVAYINLESVLELALDWRDFVLERVVSELRLALPFIVNLLIRVISDYLLFILLNKGWLQHIDPMLSVNLI